MRNIAIITDSSCNLDSELKAKYGVDDIIPMHFYLNGKKYDASGDWKDLNADEYYGMIGNGAEVHSSQASSVDYENSFRKYLEQGCDVLSISCTAALSSSVNESRAAAKRLEADFPDQKIVCIDSLNCCYTLGMLVIDAARMRNEGKTIDEICGMINEKALNFCEVGTVDKLTYLRNAGRVGGAAAFFGGLLSVKPIVVYNEKGYNVAIEKVRGRRGSFERLADYVEKYANIDEDNRVWILHGACLDEAKQVGQLIAERFTGKELDLRYDYVESGVGSAVGPGTIIVDFYGRKEMRQLGK